MERTTKLALAIAGAGVVALAITGTSKANNGGNVNDGGKVSDKVRLWRKLEWIDALTDVQRYFLMLTGYGEGGYSPSAHNGSDGERAASAAAADNNPLIVARVKACGIDPDKLRTGSWTTFQLLAPYVAGTAFEVFGNAACPFADPTRAPMDLNLQIVLAIEHARDLQGYQGFIARPTVGNLRLGWASPGWMGYEGEHQDKIAKYRAQSTKEKFPAGLVDRTITRFPTNPAQIYAQLQSNGPA